MHIKGIVGHPRIARESVSQLRQLSDSLQSHIRALESLNEPVDSWTSILRYIVIEKLDFQSKKDWETKVVGQLDITVSTITDFLEKLCDLLEKLDRANAKNFQTALSPAQSSNRFTNMKIY